MRGNSGVELQPDNASLRMVRLLDAGGLPALPRVFCARGGNGKRSAPGVRDRYPYGTRPALRGSVRRRRIGPGQRDANSFPP